MTDRPLNHRQELFCKRYIECDFDATAAAKEAQYSEKTSYSMGPRLLKDQRIKERISELINEKLGTTREQLRYKVVKKWAKIAFADRTDDIKISTKTVEGGIKIQVVEIADTVTAKNNDIISSIEQTKDGIKIKYQDSDKALEMLGKYGGLLKEQVEIEDKTERVVFYLPENNRDNGEKEC